MRPKTPLKKIALVAGARPNFVKLAPLYNELVKFKEKFEPLIVHTGQHYDIAMSKSFFEQLNIPNPICSLNVGSGSHGAQTGKIMIEFEKFLFDYCPDLVVVFGDVNSTVACSISAAKLNIPICHVEAGLRSYDRLMPEEINRVLTDSISDLLLTPSQDGNDNLLKEGIPLEKIFLVGNIMIDTLHAQLDNAKKTRFSESLKLEPKQFHLLTLHRPSNVDLEPVFREIIETFNEINDDLPVVWPAHPRSIKKIQEFKIDHLFNLRSPISKEKINIIEPLGYLQMLNLLTNTKIVFTDSGGLQEESTALKVPCLTLRENTERPITISEGSNQLVGTKKHDILLGYEKAIKKDSKECKIPTYWDGKTAERIIRVISNYFQPEDSN